MVQILFAIELVYILVFSFIPDGVALYYFFFFFFKHSFLNKSAEISICVGIGLVNILRVL